MNVWNFILSSCMRSRSSQSAIKADQYDSAASGYLQHFESENGNERAQKRKEITNSYYDLATDFYEMGWGENFHFAPRFSGETLRESLVRHEYRLCLRLGMRPNQTVLDAGCGIMGPARNMARFSGAKIVGLNLNKYQVERAAYLNGLSALKENLDVVHGDFVKTNFENDTFDHIYSIEAFCHAPDRLSVFKEMFRILKPGGKLAFYDWVLTEKYDENNSIHNSIVLNIERGNGIAKLIRESALLELVKKAGFDVKDCDDLAATAISKGENVPWFQNFSPSFSLKQISLTAFGRFIVNKSCLALESIKIAPKGTTKLHAALCDAANALVHAGKESIFTPMLFVLACKNEQ